MNLPCHTISSPPYIRTHTHTDTRVRNASGVNTPCPHIAKYAFTHTCRHAKTYIHIGLNIHTFVWAYTYIHSYGHTQTYIHMGTHKHTFTRVHKHAFISVIHHESTCQHTMPIKGPPIPGGPPMPGPPPPNISAMSAWNCMFNICVCMCVCVHTYINTCPTLLLAVSNICRKWIVTRI